MSNLQIVLITVLICLIVLGTLWYLLPYLKKKNIDVAPILETADEVVDKSGELIDVVDKLKLVPTPVLDVIKIIRSIAEDAVKQAEQLYLASNLKADDRNAKAKDVIYSTLDLLKIDRNESLDKIIDSCIETNVLLLGHNPDLKQLLQEKERLQTEKDQALSQVQQLQNEKDELVKKTEELQEHNAKLTEVVNSIQNTVNIGQATTTNVSQQ